MVIEAPALALQKVRCQECSKEKCATEVTVMGDCTRCWDCWVVHRKRLTEFLAADYVNCTTCGVKLFEQGNFRGYMSIIDGAYGLLCRSCRDTYAPKRKDLYKGTGYGAHLKL